MFKRLFKSITFDNGVEFSDVKGWYEMIKCLEGSKSFTEELAKAVTIEQIVEMLKGQDVWREIPKGCF